MGQPIRLVTIAASAGGIPALRELLSALPADYPASVAIVQHRTEHKPDLLSRVLARRCKLPVSQVQPGEPILPGHVYLAPAREHLLIRPDQPFTTTDGRKIRHVRSSADPLFQTAAQVFGSAVIAVVLTGGDADASDGVQAVKSAGGTVIVQDEATSQCFSMPASAISTGAVDYILPLGDIGPAVVRLTKSSRSHQDITTGAVGGIK
jgi:two-component system chemotaxis response regulator CheB